MATKEEMEAVWDRLSQRLRDDPKLAEVVESIENALGGTVESEPRRRLKVPYANTSPMESNGAWK